ncbi:MAG: hypothetical protein IJ094_02105 [Bacilli bacterium]|nr:hypothetical protein [Bacilli bacterium]
MASEKYDKIIQNIGGSKFTAYYIKGKNIKLSDGTTVINIWKPMAKKYSIYGDEVYKDAVIEVSGNGTNVFTYQQYKQIDKMVEFGIDLLNSEKENLIDRDKESTLEVVKQQEVIPNKKTEAIKYKDLEIGGIYEDEKHKRWVFLGKGTLFHNGTRYNRSNDGTNFSEYIYLEYPEDNLEEIESNSFMLKDIYWPDSYASKKRFFSKVGNINIDLNSPITILQSNDWGWQIVPGLKPNNIWDFEDVSTGSRKI